MNQNCKYRTTSWLGSIRPAISYVFSVFTILPRNLSLSLSRIVSREVEKARIRAIEQRGMQQGQDKDELPDAGLQEQARLTGTNLRKPLTDERK